MPDIHRKLLKKDTFSEIYRVSDGPDQCIVRDTAAVQPWARIASRRLLGREARALAVLNGLSGVPELLDFDGYKLRRSFLAGEPMQIARPADPDYYRQAKKLLRKIHRAGIVHNDLAKEPNWLVSDDGAPAIVDFQLAGYRSRRNKLFRILAREDLRHLLKHKRTYCADQLTTRELHILANPSALSRLWMSTGKKAYLLITRRLLGWSDREGAGDR